MDKPPRLIHTKHNRDILDDISRNLHNTTRRNHRGLKEKQFIFGLHSKSMLFHSSLNIWLSSDATLPVNVQNDVINETTTIILTSVVLALTKKPVDNRI